MRERKGPSITSLVAFGVLLMLPVLYVLSYVPACLSGPVVCGESAFYRPVDLLIDHTPLRRPFMAWADVWGARPLFQYAHYRRIFDSDEDSVPD